MEHPRPPTVSGHLAVREPLRMRYDYRTDPALKSDYLDPGHLLALGRIAELSAHLEQLLISVLAGALGMGRDPAVALFLGDRYYKMHRRLLGLAEIRGLPGEKWIAEAIAWSKRVNKLIEDRDALLHRAPIYLFSGDPDENEDGPRLGWQPARRNQSLEYVDGAKMLQLVVEMHNAFKEGERKCYGEPFDEGSPEWST